MIQRELILNEIRRVAEENGGKAPGFQRFHAETGIERGEWYPHTWLRWGDALKEAGLTPNKLNERHDEKYVLEKYALLVRELGHRPVVGEVRRKSKLDKEFPAHTVFANRYDGLNGLMFALREFCNAHKGFEDVFQICQPDFDVWMCLRARLQRDQKRKLKLDTFI